LKGSKHVYVLRDGDGGNLKDSDGRLLRLFCCPIGFMQSDDGRNYNSYGV